MVREAKEEIVAGEIFQIVALAALGDRLSDRGRADALSRAALDQSVAVHVPAAHERVHARRRVAGDARARHGRTSPRRGRSPARVRAARRATRIARSRQSLLADPKENAEHLMLVDLGRNDLGRVCASGTSRSTTSATSSATATSCTSSPTSQGTLREDRTPVDAFLSCFPAGTRQRRAEDPRHGADRPLRERRAAARTPAPSPTSASPATSTRASPSARSSLAERPRLRAGRRRHRLRLRSGDGVRGDGEQIGGAAPGDHVAKAMLRWRRRRYATLSGAA